jgi:hypothetical protein
MDQQRRSSDYADDPVAKAAPFARNIPSCVIETKRGQGDKAEQGRDRDTAHPVASGRPANLHVNRDQCPSDNQKGIGNNAVDDDEEMLDRVMLRPEFSDDANPFVECQPGQPG